MKDKQLRIEIKKWCKENGYDFKRVLVKMVRWVKLGLANPDFKSLTEREIISRQFGRSANLKKMIHDYGEEDGLKKWQSYCERQAYTNTKEYKQMTDEEFDKFNKSRAATRENLILRHGEEDGLKKWQSYCERQAYTNTKEYFVEKYGMADGEKRYMESCKQKGHTIENYIRLYGDEAEKRLEEFYKSVSSNFCSKSSIDFFDSWEDLLTPEERKHTYREYSVYSKTNERIFVYDWFNTKLKVAVEYNGVYYHAKPSLYKDSDILIFGNSVHDVWGFDYQKMKAIFSERDVVDYKIVWQYEEPDRKDMLRWLDDIRNNRRL